MTVASQTTKITRGESSRYGVHLASHNQYADYVLSGNQRMILSRRQSRLNLALSYHHGVHGSSSMARYGLLSSPCRVQDSPVLCVRVWRTMSYEIILLLSRILFQPDFIYDAQSFS